MISRNGKIKLGIVAAFVVTVALVLLFSARAQFVVGGALVNLGFRMQDHLEAYDLTHHEEITPQEIWTAFVDDNMLSSSVRKAFPRTARHPLVAMVICMDARIDAHELAGDTRNFYYVVRTAGSVMQTKEMEMLELAVVNGVKVVILTTHSDCAAEKVSRTPELREQFPAIAEAVDGRPQQVEEFLKRPIIASRIESGQLLVKWMDIDTANEQVTEHKEPPAR